MAGLGPWVQASARRAAGGIVAAALVIALLGGLALACLAGARRTASAFDRYLDDAEVADLSLNPGNLTGADFRAAVASLDQVEWARTDVAFNGVVDQQPSGAEIVGSVDGRYFDRDIPVYVRGEPPDTKDADAVILNEYAAAQFAVDVGDAVDVALYTEEQLYDPSFDPTTTPAQAAARVRVAGVVTYADEVAQDESDRLPRLVFTPAFTKDHLELGTYFWQGVELERGARDAPAVRAAFSDLIAEWRPEEPFPGFVRDTVAVAERVDRAVRPHVVALFVFGAVTALAALVLGAQAVSRLVRAVTTDLRVLASLGARPRDLRSAVATLAAVPVVTGAVGAVALAIALSPLMPIGTARDVEPSRGVSFDATIVAGGAVAIGFVLMSAAVLSAGRFRAGGRLVAPVRGHGGERVTDRATRSLPLPARIGVGFALPAGRGVEAGQARSVMGAALVAVAVVIAALTFGASLRNLVHTPELFGWSANAVVIDDGGYGEIDIERAESRLEGEPLVTGFAGAAFVTATVGDRDVPALVLVPVRGDLHPPVVDGRGLRSPDEIVVGARTLRQLRASVGSTVELDLGEGPSRHRIVGVATFPSVGVVRGTRTSLGDGILMSAAPGDVPISALFVQFPDGADQARSVEQLREITAPLGSRQGSLDVGGTLQPAEIAEHEAMEASPRLLALAVGAGVAVSLQLALAASARRRRRDLVILKVLGMTNASASRALRVHAAVVVAIGLVLGVPLGIAAGRWAWRAYASGIDVVDVVVVPVIGLVMVALVATLVAVLAAAVPTRIARAAPVAVLRTE